MTITVYSREECVQCKYTKAKLDENGLEYTDLDIDSDAEARKVVEDSGNTALPLVVVKRGEPGNVTVTTWHGLRVEEIKALAKAS